MIQKPPLVHELISEHIVQHVRANLQLTFERKVELLQQAIEFHSVEALDILSALYISSQKTEEAYNLVMQHAHKFGYAGQYIKFIILERLAFAENLTEKKFLLVYSALRTAVNLLVPHTYDEALKHAISHHIIAYFHTMQRRMLQEEKFDPMQVIKHHIYNFLLRIKNEEELMCLQLSPDQSNILSTIESLLQQFHEYQLQ